MRNALLLLMLWAVPLAVQALPPIEPLKIAGARGLLAQDETLPIIELQLFFKGAGTVSDPQARQGRAALAASMLMEGAGGKSAAEFAKALENKAIKLSLQPGRDGLAVSLKTLRENREQAFALMADMLLRSHLNTEPLAMVQQKMAVERQRLQELPGHLAQRAFTKAAYGSHPYAQSQLGTDASVAALTPDDVREYLQRYLARDNLIISVAGAISADELTELLEPTLNALPAEARPERALLMASWPVKSVFSIEVEHASPQSLLLFARSGIDRSDPDFYAAYLLNHILGGGSLTSRLGEEVRKKRGLTYGINTSLESGLYASRWLGSVATQNATASEAKEAIEATLQTMANKGVTAKELAAAKTYVTGSFPLRIDSYGAIVSYLTSMQLHDLGANYLSKRNAYFEAVTLEQVNALAAKWLKEQTWSWVRVGPNLQKD